MNWMTDILGLDKKNIHELDFPDTKNWRIILKKLLILNMIFLLAEKNFMVLLSETDFDLKKFEF